MQQYLFSIEMSFLIFPFIAAFITMPYVIYQYRKFGAIPILRTLILYSFVLYLLCAYFLVILPLPSLEEVANSTNPTMQLIPFTFITDIFTHTHFVWNDISSYIQVIQDSAFIGALFNLILFMPFGIYLRYYFHLSLPKTVLYAFLLSLFFEYTQLSGLYGIYPRPYRLFDVDDLMINTLGGMIGYLITPMFVFLLPEKSTLDQLAYKKGKRIPFFRRFMAFCIDFCFVSFICIWLHEVSIWQLLFVPFLYFFIFTSCFDGRTIGKAIVKIKVVNADERKAKIIQYFIRYFILYIVILPIPFYCFFLFSQTNFPLYLFPLLFIGGYALFFIQVIFSIWRKDKILIYERWSHTKNISTIPIPEQERDKKEPTIDNVDQS